MVCCYEGKVPGGLLHLVWLPDSQNVVPFTDPISTVLLLTPPRQMYPTMPVIDSTLSRPLLTTLILSWHSNLLCSPYKPSSSKCLSNNSWQCSLLNWFWLRCRHSLHFHYAGPSLFGGVCLFFFVKSMFNVLRLVVLFQKPYNRGTSFSLCCFHSFPALMSLVLFFSKLPLDSQYEQVHLCWV